MEHQDTYLICQLSDSFNEQTDTEMCSVAKGQKYGKPTQFGQVLPNWYRYIIRFIKYNKYLLKVKSQYLAAEIALDCTTCNIECITLHASLTL